jgi:hypothetical protein
MDSNPRSHLKEEAAELHLFDSAGLLSNARVQLGGRASQAPDEVGPRVRIRLPPGESRVRTCMLAELDQTEESQIDLGRLLVRVAAPPRAADGLGRLPVRVAVAGAAVGAAAASAYTAYPPRYYRPACGYYPYPACQ